MRESRGTPWLVSLGWGHSPASLHQTTLWIGYPWQEDFQEMEGAEEHLCVTQHPWPTVATASTAASLPVPPPRGWGFPPPQPGSRGEAESTMPPCVNWGGGKAACTSADKRDRKMTVTRSSCDMIETPQLSESHSAAGRAACD